MNKRIVKILLLAISILMLYSCKKEVKENNVVETTIAETKKNENVMDDFSCETNKGETFTLSGRNKPAFINFWATWCGPCRMEMPDLQDVYDEYKDRVDFVFINCGDTKETISSFINESEISYTFPIGYDESDELSYKFNITGIPTTYIVKVDGEISDIVVGARSGDDYRKLLNKVLTK